MYLRFKDTKICFYKYTSRAIHNFAQQQQKTENCHNIMKIHIE